MGHKPLRYLALGDSYTIGEGVEENEQWPMQMARRLRAEGVLLNDPKIVAMTGWTTDELGAGISEADPHGRYDLVSLLIGVNNQYRSRTVDEYRRQFRELLRQAIVFAGGNASRVLVVSIPDWGVTPFANGRERNVIASDIDDFNRTNREEAGGVGAAYADITPLSRKQGRMVVGDGLHPNGEAYAAWTDLVLPVARQLLAATGTSS